MKVTITAQMVALQVDKHLK